MRRANGSGSISKVNKKLKKPFLVRVTYYENGKMIRKSIGLYATRREANNKLDEYNFNPYDLDNKDLTFSKLYEIFIKGKKGNSTESKLKAYEYSFNRCKPLYNMVFIDIKTPQLQLFFNNLKGSSGTKKITQSFISQLYNLAMQLEFIQVNRVKFVELGEYKKVHEKNIFTKQEIQILWDNVSTIPGIDVILILIYTGFRISELLELKKDNVDILNGFMRGGNKTKTGKKRIVPIHKDIEEIIKVKMETSKIYLIETRNREVNKDKPVSYNYYLTQFKEIMKALGMEHNPHETRHTFATLSSNSGLNPVAIKDIMGHSDYMMTEKVYTHKDKEEIKKEIDKFTVN